MPLVSGTVIGYSPPLQRADEDENNGSGVLFSNEKEEAEFPTERQKEDEPLFRILWDGHSSSAYNSSGEDEDDIYAEDSTAVDHPVVGYIEDVTLTELFPSLLAYDERTSSSKKKSRLELRTVAALSVHKHVHASTSRKQLAFEYKIECELLPHLVTLAALELRKETAQSVRLEMLLERKRLRIESGLDRSSKNGKHLARGGVFAGKGAEEIVVNRDGDEFGYYSAHPSQYMPSFTPPPLLSSDDEDEDESDEDGDISRPRSTTRLTAAELERYRKRLEVEVALAPSKIAERVRLACSMAYDYVAGEGLLEKYYAECSTRNENEQVEKHRMSR